MTNKTQYTAVVRLSSVGKSDDVKVTIDWEPELTGDDIVDIGFLPASFQFVDDYIFPALLAAMEDNEDDADVLGIEPRSVN